MGVATGVLPKGGAPTSLVTLATGELWLLFRLPCVD